MLWYGVPFRGDVAALVVALLVYVGSIVGVGWLIMGVSSSGTAGSLVDAPIIWYDNDDADIPEPEVRDPNLIWEGPKESIGRAAARSTRPSRLKRRCAARWLRNWGWRSSQRSSFLRIRIPMTTWGSATLRWTWFSFAG